jgi:hypothetical protein
VCSVGIPCAGGLCLGSYSLAGYTGGDGGYFGSGDIRCQVLGCSCMCLHHSYEWFGGWSKKCIFPSRPDDLFIYLFIYLLAIFTISVVLVIVSHQCLVFTMCWAYLAEYVLIITNGCCVFWFGKNGQPGPCTSCAK